MIHSSFINWNFIIHFRSFKFINLSLNLIWFQSHSLYGDYCIQISFRYFSLFQSNFILIHQLKIIGFHHSFTMEISWNQLSLAISIEFQIFHSNCLIFMILLSFDRTLMKYDYFSKDHFIMLSLVLSYKIISTLWFYSSITCHTEIHSKSCFQW